MDSVWPPIGNYHDAVRETPMLPGETPSEYVERLRLKAMEDAAPGLPYREPGDDTE